MAASKSLDMNADHAFSGAVARTRAPGRDYQSTPDPQAMLFVVVAWSIVKGREDEFLAYWSVREAIDDRSGLVGEFLNRVRGDDEMPCATWRCSDACSTFLNVGIWRSCEAFRRQVGPKIRNGRTMLPFEHEPRRRLFLGPERWRLGGSLMPLKEHAAVH